MYLLQKYGVDIKLRNKSIPKIQRKNDPFIIDNVLTSSSSLTILKKIHACRLYLQVTFLLDIANLKGDSTLSHSVQGIRA